LKDDDQLTIIKKNHTKFSEEFTDDNTIDKILEINTNGNKIREEELHVDNLYTIDDKKKNSQSDYIFDQMSSKNKIDQKKKVYKSIFDQEEEQEKIDQEVNQKRKVNKFILDKEEEQEKISKDKMDEKEKLQKSILYQEKEQEKYKKNK